MFTAESGSEQQDAEMSSSSEYEESAGGESEEVEEESDVEIGVEGSPLEGSEPSKTSVSGNLPFLFTPFDVGKVFNQADLLYRCDTIAVVVIETSRFRSLICNDEL